jgi:hypothetical protein
MYDRDMLAKTLAYISIFVKKKLAVLDGIDN